MGAFVFFVRENLKRISFHVTAWLCGFWRKLNFECSKAIKCFVSFVATKMCCFYLSLLEGQSDSSFATFCECMCQHVTK